MDTKEAFKTFLKGILMGSADIIPGVSGGTMALVTGIYERLVFGIKSIDFRFVPLLLKGDFGGAKKNVERIDFALFAPLLLGIGLAFLLLSGVIKYFLYEVTAPTYAFFFGLILASAFIVYKHVDRITPRNVAFASIGFAFAFLLVGLRALQADHSLPVIFLSGMLAICAMILPGISGAFILVFLGQYKHMIDALHGLEIPVIAVFIAGAFIGIVAFSRVLSYLLEKHKGVTMAFLVGLMVGALRKPYEEAMLFGGGVGQQQLLFILAPAVLGFLAVFLLEMMSRKN